MILASILISSDEQEEANPPAMVLENIDSFKRVHPGLPHRLFTTTSIRELMRKHFDARVLNAYDKLRPFAYKADLARHCIMYLFGGVYADVGIHFLNPWSPGVLAGLDHPNGNPAGGPLRLAVFRDFQGASVWDTVSGIYSAPPRHKAMLRAIQMICRNAESEFYGKSCLCPTGPTLFGKAIATTCEAEDLVVGDSRWVTAQMRIPRLPLGGLTGDASHGFVFGSKLIAVRTKRGGASITQLGISGGNDYIGMWNARQIYAAGDTAGMGA